MFILFDSLTAPNLITQWVSPSLARARFRNSIHKIISRRRKLELSQRLRPQFKVVGRNQRYEPEHRDYGLRNAYPFFTVHYIRGKSGANVSISDAFNFLEDCFIIPLYTSMVCLLKKYALQVYTHPVNDLIYNRKKYKVY